jgi:hypothetical protein
MRRSTVFVGLIALSLSGAPALAFQEIPVPPPDIPTAELQPNTLQLGTPGGGATAPAPGEEGLNVFGYTVLPKLHLGFDVLYGQEQQQLELQGPSGLEENDDSVSVLGKVKRRF